MQEPSTLDDAALAAEIARITERLRRDCLDYPLNWRFIGERDKGRLAECWAEHARRKTVAAG